MSYRKLKQLSVNSESTMKSIGVIFLVFVANAVVDGRMVLPKNVISGRVVGGRDAKKGEAPYQVSLQTEYMGSYDPFCGGAIIGERSILTAGHCVHRWNPELIRVITGTNNWKKPGHIYFVESIKVHCNFNVPQYNNDIAVLTLNSSIKFDANTQKIELNHRELNDGDNITLTGWGSTKLWGGVPDNLQIINLKHVSNDNCRAVHKHSTDVGIGHLCTFTKINEGACHGDSGSGLTSGGKLVGLVNWGTPCAVGTPDVHAKIAYYHDFISTTIKGCAS